MDSVEATAAAVPDRPRTTWPVLAVAVVAAVVLLLATLHALGTGLGDGRLLLQLVRFVAAAALVVVLPGFGLARLLTPSRLVAWWPVLVLPLGFAGAMVGLTVLALVGLRPRPATAVFLLASAALAVWSLRGGRGAHLRADRAGSAALLVGAVAAGLLTLVPVLSHHMLTVFGDNPDAHQVVGVAWFLQQSYPLQVNTATALDQVPPAWAGRIPIFHPYGAAIEAGVTGPIQMFAPFVAVLATALAAAAGLLAAVAYRLPGWAAGIVAIAVGGSAATLYSALHPYYNQLWGMFLMVTTLALAWTWLRDEDSRAGALAVVFAVLALIAYPTTLPYTVLAVVAIAIGVRRRPRMPAGLRRRLRRVWPLVLIFFGLSVLAALGKLAAILVQFVGDQPFWVGDIIVFPRHGTAYGIDSGSLLVPIAIGLVAVVGVGLVDRRAWPPWLVLIAGLLGIDLILRHRTTAEYVDYKHVIFTALIVLPLAVGGALTLVRRWRPLPTAIGIVLLGAWAYPAATAARDELRATEPNVTPELLDVQQWSARIPRGRSILLDIPASGTQLWATLFLGADHPLATTDPVSARTTYSVAPLGRRADYVLGLRRDLRTLAPVPPPRWAVGRPIVVDDAFAIWRMQLPPAAARTVPETASDKLVLPHPSPETEAQRRARVQLTRNPSTVPGH